jgi:hypothetical protein
VGARVAGVSYDGAGHAIDFTGRDGAAGGNAMTVEAPDAAHQRESALAAAVPAGLVRLGGVLALIAAAALLIYLQYRHSLHGYMSDDAFISFRYASHLADGLGPVWSPGDRVEGYTNFGWVLALAGGQKLGIDPRYGARLLGFAGAIATIAAVPVLVAQLRDAWTPRWWLVAGGAALATALNTGFVIWTFGGLEVTGVAALLMAALSAMLWEERSGRRSWLSALLFGAAAITRPDSVVVFALAGVAKAARVATTRSRRDALDLALWGLVFALPFAAYWGWRWSYYGHFYPNTYYLKTDRNADFLQRGWLYSWHWLTRYSMWLALAALFGAWRERRSAYRPLTTLLVVVVGWTAYVAVFTGGDWMPYFRFFAAMLPLAYVLMLEGALRVFDAALDARDAPRRWALPALAIFGAAVAFTAIAPRDAARARQPEAFAGSNGVLPGSVNTQGQRQIGLWLRANLPPHEAVAQIATGIVPYYSRLPTIDMLGVNDVHIAHLPIPLGTGISGHEKEDGGYVISRKPALIWFAIDLEARPRRTDDDYLKADLAYPVYTDITRNPYVWFLYRPVAIRLAGGWLNVLMRRGFSVPLPPGSIDAG